MKDAILLRYDINCEAYWQRFRQVKQQQGETPRELVTCLHDLGKRWLKDCDAVEGTIDVILVEQLLATLLEEMRI